MDSPGTIKVGEDITISYVLKNSERKINWKSSDPTVATVDENGRVEGRSAGQVEITASVDQVARSLHIRIEKPDATAIHIVSNSISSLDAANKVYELETEMTMRLQIVTDPEDGQHPDLTWESSDPFTGNVDASGLFTAKGVGDVTITARAGTMTDGVTFKIRSAVMDPNVLLRYILIAFGGFMVLILIIVLVALSIRRKKARVEAEERARRAAQRRKEAERMTRKKGQETRIREEGYQRGTMDKEREMSERMTRVFDPAVLGGGRRQPPAPRPPERPPRPEPPEQPFSIDDIEYEFISI